METNNEKILKELDDLIKQLSTITTKLRDKARELGVFIPAEKKVDLNTLNDELERIINEIKLRGLLESDVLILSKKDQELLIKNLENPPEPTSSMKEALALYDKYLDKNSE